MENLKFLGINFKKILAEKNSDDFKSLKIKNDISITSIEKIESNIIKKEELVTVNFKYSILYEPDLAKIEFLGSIILASDSKFISNLLKGWESKKLEDNFKMAIYNLIFKKSNIKALNLEEELNLPIHLQLPKISLKSEKSN